MSLPSGTGTEFEEVEQVSPGRGKNARDGRYRGKPKYRKAANALHTARQMERKFIAWDGEGVTREDGSHDYVQFASSAGDLLAGTEALKTMDVLELLLESSVTNGDGIHVIFGGKYDFNCWLADVDKETLARLYRQPRAMWRKYTLAWRQGKSLFVSDGERSVTIYDTVSFFQCSFVKACDSYLGDKFLHRDLIAEQKLLRSTFNVDDLATIIRYNAAELENLVLLMDELRNRLHKVGLRPTRWDGPGAIASALLKREGVDLARNTEVPAEVNAAARHAYFGGRFEVLRFGHVPNAPAYEYDINSAYPSAMRSLPNLQVGRWEYVSGYPGNNCFAVCRVRYHDLSHSIRHIPGPLPFRIEQGNICYPHQVEGWYWLPEVKAAAEYCSVVIPDDYIFEVVGAWVWRPGKIDEKDWATKGREFPFHFVDGLYNKRKALKAGGDGAHVGIKLALNSLYGKLAQQVGWGIDKKTGAVRIPPFHQLEWAGYITAVARSQILKAAQMNPDAIIAFETDAIFSSAPLAVDVGSGLGQWEGSEFTDLTYIQSGLYFGTLHDGTPVEKTRGVDRGTLGLQEVLVTLGKEDDRVAPAQLTRFVGLGIALQQGMQKWRRWEVVTKGLKLEPQGKRSHFLVGSRPCCDNRNVVDGTWHATWCAWDTPGMSSPFPVEWARGVEPEDDERRSAGEWELYADG